MFIPILLFAVAGAILGGVAGGGVALWGTARRKAAEEEIKQTADLKKAALRAEIDLASVEAEARAAGLDPAEVLKGIDAVMAGQVTLNQIRSIVQPQQAIVL